MNQIRFRSYLTEGQVAKFINKSSLFPASKVLKIFSPGRKLLMKGHAVTRKKPSNTVYGYTSSRVSTAEHLPVV